MFESHFFAEEILKNHWNGFAPVNILSLVRSLGVEVFYRKNFLYDSGAFFLDETRICIKEGLPSIHFRFLIAKELYFLKYKKIEHKTTLKSIFFKEDAFGYEAESNFFAMSLLIPDEEILFLLKRQGQNKTIVNFSEYFNVYPVLIKAKLEHLNILKGNQNIKVLTCAKSVKAYRKEMLSVS